MAVDSVEQFTQHRFHLDAIASEELHLISQRLSTQLGDYLCIETVPIVFSQFCQLLVQIAWKSK